MNLLKQTLKWTRECHLIGKRLQASRVCVVCSRPDLTSLELRKRCLLQRCAINSCLVADGGLGTAEERPKHPKQWKTLQLIFRF